MRFKVELRTASITDVHINTSNLTLFPNSQACLEVVVTQDGLMEDDESFYIQLIEVIGESFSDAGATTVVIINSDGIAFYQLLV